MKRVFIICLCVLLITGGGVTIAGNHQKLQSKLSDVARHTKALEDKKQANAKKIILEIESAELKRRQKLDLQLQIGCMRTLLGGITDLRRRKSIQQQILKLQIKKAEL